MVSDRETGIPWSCRASHIARGITLLVGTALFSGCESRAEGTSNEQAGAPVKVASLDIVAAALPRSGPDIAIAGRNGTLGWVRLDGADARLRLDPEAPDTDFTAIAPAEGEQLLVGDANGRLYRFGPGQFDEVAHLSEFDEPILDIAENGSSYWAVGARGLVAKSDDATNWETVGLESVDQPPLIMPSGYRGDLSLGVANVDSETFELAAFVDGVPAREGVDYELYAEEGLLILNHPLDAQPPPAVSFEFSPGPAFRRGDVSWNVVLADGDEVIVAGEFGLILRSTDNGLNWVRADGRIGTGEHQVKYWLAGDRRGQHVVLVGAGGAVAQSRNGGSAWSEMKGPTQEGLFGAMLVEQDAMLVLGAVGLAATFHGEQWSAADRTDLRLLSWLRSPVRLPDGDVVAFGGRSTVIRHDGDKWSRVNLSGS